MDASLAELIAFEIDRQRFGVPLADVHEVHRAVRVVPLPDAPPVIEGVINLRGKVIAVLDIRARFGLPPRVIELSDRLVIAQAASRTVAIRVDRVIDLLKLASEEIGEVRTIAPAGQRIAGVAKLPDGMVLIHDLATFLSQAESEALGLAEENARR